jgi:hypothetical protein
LLFGRFPGFAVFPSGKSSLKIDMNMEQWWNDTGRKNPKCCEKILSQSHFSATNLKWIDRELNPGFHAGRAVTKINMNGTNI